MGNTENKVLSALKDTVSAGLSVQSYCTAVKEQPLFLLPEDLKAKLPDVNGYLKTAQGNANQYLNTIQPKLITVVTDTSAFSLQFPQLASVTNEYLKAWSVGSQENRQKALDSIEVIQKLLNGKMDNVTLVTSDLTTISGLMQTDKGRFQEASEKSGELISGDQGELSTIRKQLKTVDGQIAGASVGVALSGLAVAGGIFMILVGSIASFVTEGTSTPMVVAGGALVCAGVGGLTGSSIALTNLIKEKGDLLTRQSTLNQYVTVLDGVTGNMDTLSTEAGKAVMGLSSMSNAWNLMKSDLDEVKQELESAQQFSDLPEMVQAFFDSAQEQWKGVDDDIKIIKQQLTGVTIKNIQTKDAKLLTTSHAPLGLITPESVRQMIRLA